MSIKNLSSSGQVKAQKKGKAAKTESQPEQPYKDASLSVSQNLDREQRTVFIGNIAITTDKKLIIKPFKKVGTIEKMWMGASTVESKSTVKSLTTTKNCYIMFSKKAEATRATEELNNLVIDSRHINVTMANNIEKDYNTTVFVANLSENADEEEIRSFFEDCGVIEFVRVVRDKQTFKCMGFCYIKFNNKIGLLNALQNKGKLFNGLALKVSKAKPVIPAHELPQHSLKSTLFGDSKGRVAPFVPKTEEERAEEEQQVNRLARNTNADHNDYNEAMMNNVFKHQGCVPNSQVKKSLKKLKKQCLTGSALTIRTSKIMANAQKRLNKEYFEKDDLLKERRELRKKKKAINAIKFKKSMKSPSAN
jgi:RNA recognition motif-containing protein